MTILYLMVNQMKKLIITSFVLIFILAGIGLGVSLYQFYSTTANLRSIINLHEIEDVRQALSYNFQKMQSYTFSTPDYLIENVDEIIDNAEAVNRTLARCHDCHHEPEVDTDILEVGKQIEDYQEQLSYLITKVSDGELRREQQLVAIKQGNVILQGVQGMISRAASSLNNKTASAMNRIEDSYIILGLTLLFTFLAAQFVAHYLTSRITKPIDHLLTAAREISRGGLGHQIDYQAPGEFQELISAFNNMSESLARQDENIRNSLKKLHQISHVTLPLHTALDTTIIIEYLHKTMRDLIPAEYVGIMLPDDNNAKYVLHLYDTGRMDSGPQELVYTESEITKVFNRFYGEAVYENSLQDDAWPFPEKPAGVTLKSLLLAWMLIGNNAKGALIAINKKEGNFVDEDFEMLNLLANNMIVAFDNIRLFASLQEQMGELHKTQRQLIESEKLKALGTLAGGVAHDFNNILCGMIGYVTLLKRNLEPGDRDYRMLDTIENAGFRAAELTKQLLTFSRQEAKDHRPISVNQHIENVARILENTVSKLITVRLDLAASLPPVASDPAQLEQIVINLGVNARDAMPVGGEILVKSTKFKADYEFCSRYPKAKPGDYIRITVSDTGKALQDITPRMFDPFFTDKDVDKGTDLGLAMVYGIVKSHRGFMIIESQEGKGTNFSVYLPAVEVIEEKQAEPVAPDRLHQAGILIVDDEELVAAMLAEHLQNLGCRYSFHAGNGEEALVILKQHKDRIDVAILDLNMPVMDGQTAYEKMLEIKPELKVLLASGSALDSTVEEILARGANGFIQKPYSLKKMAEKIKQVMQG